MRRKSHPSSRAERKQLSEEHKRKIRAGIARRKERQRAQPMSVTGGAILSDPAATADPVGLTPPPESGFLSIELLRENMISAARNMIARAEGILRLLGEE
jgi:hypothetical protein